VRWNETAVAAEFRHLSNDLPATLARMAERAKLPASLRELGIPQEALPKLAEDAAAQWTGRFNPRLFNRAAAQEIYAAAY